MSEFRKNFTSCAKCARDGFGGAVLAHAGCLAAPALAGVFGATLSGTFMMAAMYVASPVIAVGATYGLDKARGVKSSAVKLASSAVIALGVSFGLSQVMGHGHDHGSHGRGHEGHEHHHHGHSDARQWLEQRSPEELAYITQAAGDRGLSVLEFAAEICGDTQSAAMTLRP